MKLQHSQSSRGNTLMVVLFFCVAIGMVVAGVLKLISARYTTAVRSNDWNQCIPVLEAGVEEAMTHLHDDSSVSANGWTAGSLSGTPGYSKLRTFNDGSYFNVFLVVTNPNAPIIYSQGFVRSPLSGSRYISRMVMVGATNPPNLFTKALATTGTITLSGGGSIKGFDSRLGPYDPVTNINATASIATDSTNKPAISVGTGHVYGTATTGPGGTVSVAGGAVGDVSWNTNHSGVETGYTNNNMNVSFPTNTAPSLTPTTWPALITAGGSNVTMLAGSVTGPPTYYTASSYTSSSSSGPMFVTGNVVVYLSSTGNALTVSGSGYIKLFPGASLTIVVAGTATVSGGGVVNGTGLASDFSLVGTSTSGTITYSGSAAFIGTVNAPQADVTISGSGTATGAIIGKTATLSGGASLLYDDALGASSGLVATSWKEL